MDAMDTATAPVTPVMRFELPPASLGVSWPVWLRCLMVSTIADAYDGYAVATDGTGRAMYRARFTVNGVRYEVCTCLETGGAL